MRLSVHSSPSSWLLRPKIRPFKPRIRSLRLEIRPPKSQIRPLRPQISHQISIFSFGPEICPLRPWISPIRLQIRPLQSPISPLRPLIIPLAKVHPLGHQIRDGLADKWMNKRNFPCVLLDFFPFWTAAQKEMVPKASDGQRYTLPLS